MYEDSFQTASQYGHNRFIATCFKGDPFGILDLSQPLHGPGWRFYSVETGVGGVCFLNWQQYEYISMVRLLVARWEMVIWYSTIQGAIVYRIDLERKGLRYYFKWSLGFSHGSSRSSAFLELSSFLSPYWCSKSLCLEGWFIRKVCYGLCLEGSKRF
jgi:hypothetical protein